jgi:hypothetical protein
MYKLTPLNILSEKQENVCRLQDMAFIPFDPENTDYINFKEQINDESAQLETVDGVVMTPDEAKAYVATLP